MISTLFSLLMVLTSSTTVPEQSGNYFNTIHKIQVVFSKLNFSSIDYNEGADGFSAFYRLGTDEMTLTLKIENAPDANLPSRALLPEITQYLNNNLICELDNVQKNDQKAYCQGRIYTALRKILIKNSIVTITIIGDSTNKAIIQKLFTDTKIIDWPSEPFEVSQG